MLIEPVNNFDGEHKYWKDKLSFIVSSDWREIKKRFQPYQIEKEIRS